MVWETCNLILNSTSTYIFITGDIVTGTVVLKFKKEQKIKYINFRIIGISKTSWSRSKPVIPYWQFYSENKRVLDIELDTFIEYNGKTVLPGIYSHQFHFCLPTDLPSTFESSIGRVHYYIEIEGKTSCRFIKTKTVPFTVMGNVNINDSEEFLKPSNHEIKKTFWNSNEFLVTLKLFTGFASNQSIPFQAVFTNVKKVKISKLNVSLIQKIKYNVAAGYANDDKKICKVVYNNFSNTVQETCRFNMDVPQIQPSTIYLINPMIDISYIFRVEINFPFHSTLHEDIPVTVATISVMHRDFNTENK